MKTDSSDAVGYVFEPGLLSPVPRLVRRRVSSLEQSERKYSRWWEVIMWIVSVPLFFTLSLLVTTAYASMPVWFGQIVPAKILYYAAYGETLPKDPALWNNRISAHLSYDWDGKRRQEFVWVDSGLMKAYPNRSIVPVKVLGSWFNSVVWVDGHGDAYWQRLVSSGWLPLRRFALLWFGAFGFFALIIPFSQRLDAKMVREGVPEVGRIVSYRDWLGRLIEGELPKKGLVTVRYEYRLWVGWWKPAVRIVRASRSLPVERARLLPPAGRPMTMLHLPSWWGFMLGIVLYPLSPYEAVPPLEESLTPTLIPFPRGE